MNAPCSACGGSGVFTDMVPECCGNPYPGGECRGHCAVPRQVEVPCGDCGGCGHQEGAPSEKPATLSPEWAAAYADAGIMPTSEFVRHQRSDRSPA